ncbi:MAG: cation-translocating P-type ATPase, partial [Deltaproteobacteria bacterium]|nr:cation-translocating P-type ATPase [Deltaproteobacteria bacterium]
GDVFLVRPGESVPTDGVIRSGDSSFDESSVTGESVPVDKGPGTKVFAGAFNRQGAVEIEATASFADNTLAKIIHLVQEAQEQKGATQQWIERFGRRYSPAVLATSLLLLLVPWLLGLSAAEWGIRAVVLLVAAAPCALVMSTPVAMAAGIGSAGKRGILIKGGAHLEHLGTIRVVAFDKTGTLTHGKPTVTDIRAFQGTEAEVLAVAAGLEHFSEHPLARAIVNRACEDGISSATVTGFAALTGAGAKAVFQGMTWYVGSPSLFTDLGLMNGLVSPHVEQLQAQGKTVVLVGNPTVICGLLALQDQVRAGARETLTGLRNAGIHVVMLTGDNARTGRAVALTLGIEDVRADLKPEDKVKAVKDLETQYGPVLMVGDGVNDAPALAAATCGVAMGVAGSDAAIEAADVALMAEDLAKVEEALSLGRRVRTISRQNITFSILILVILIPAAVLGVLGVTAAVFTHEVSELLAVANGLRVRGSFASPAL